MTLATYLARHWPFANGAGRLIDRFARNVDLGKGERLALTNDGFYLHVLADDHIGRHILLTGQFDRSIVQVLLDNARADDVLLDIGANVGYVSACFLARVENSTVVCVEPQPGIVDLLRLNMAKFGDRAHIHQVALSDTSGELRFEINIRNRGASKISREGTSVVPAVIAADLLCTLSRVDLIKIDVEGHELPIFKSIEEELIRLRPRAILFEDQTGAAAPDGAIGTILSRVGYDIFGIEKHLLETRLVPVKSGDDGTFFNDYLGIAR